MERLTFREFWNQIPSWVRHLYGGVLVIKLGFIAGCWIYAFNF